MNLIEQEVALSGGSTFGGSPEKYLIGDHPAAKAIALEKYLGTGQDLFKMIRQPGQQS